MVCPNCNAEIDEDLLYCPVCGQEIQVVPYYEPEIEQSISDTLSDIQLEAEKQLETDSWADSEEYDDPDPIDYIDLDNDAYDDDLPEEYDEQPEYDEQDTYDEEFDEEYDLDYLDDFDEDEPHIMYHFLKFMKESRIRWLVIFLLLAIISAVIFGVVRLSNYMYQNNSVSYQSELAVAAAAEGDYAAAITHMERSVMLSPEDTSLKYQLAEYYFQNQETEKGILMLWEIIYAKDANYQAAYQKMINYYASVQDYGMIEEILSNCDDMIVVNQFQNYLANEPEFSTPEGTYEEIVYLKLSSNSEGTIYYTMDGTMPTYDSPVYTEPILLELGIYKINAIFVNSYGIESEVVSKTYTIDIRVPNPPNVILESGDFTIPELIEVDVQPFCKVYYTTDYTMPTDDSMEYTGPIPMPIGNSHFIFIAYSQEGIPGEITEMDYNLTLNGTAQVQDIITNMMQYNVNLGKAVDLEGNVTGNQMRYSYVVSSAIYLEDHIYYILVENMISSTNPETQSMKTGAFYLADIYDGSLYKGVRDEEGVYSRGELIPPEYYAPPVPLIPETVTPDGSTVPVQ